MKKKQTIIKELQARVSNKQVIPYTDLAKNRGVPTPSAMYEITMLTTDGEYIFYVSEYEYEVLSIGDEGNLKMKTSKYCNELISFSDKIKEFKI